ncbi:hypothetical protein [Amycolatopsis sp. CA-126428]|uniref:hypothetical protein n=1 Tax=Amycolatopsis sp. CA-126428 TaxID=2073158 RepID=UPI0011AFD852|nr:hypothetical protein [Amycolatopsis sp. CA-126428]
MANQTANRPYSWLVSCLRRRPLLVTAMWQAAPAILSASAVKSKMVSLDPAFDEANYGCASVR